MHAHAVVLLALLGCGGARTSDTVDSEPLGYLVGSWRVVGPFEARRELDLHADGTFAVAELSNDGSTPCVVLGTVRSNDGYVFFTDDPASPCGGGGDESYIRLEREDVDQFSYVQNSDLYTDCGDVPDCTLWTAVRVSGPLVSPELIAAARREVEETLRRWAEEEPEPWVPSDEPDEPYVPAEPAPEPYVPDPRVAVLEELATKWAIGVLPTGYARVSDTIRWTASWDVVPSLKANTSYQFVVIVPITTSDARANLEMAGETLELESGISDEGDYLVMYNYATIGESGQLTRDQGGLTVSYTSSYDQPALFLVLELVDP